jgi:hypothetical protein
MPGAVRSAGDPLAAYTAMFWPLSSPSYQKQLMEAPSVMAKAFADPSFWTKSLPQAWAMGAQYWMLASRIGPAGAAQVMGMAPFSTPMSLIP